MATTEATVQSVRDSAGLPMTRVRVSRSERKVAWLLAFVFFFEFADINTFSFAAPAILNSWGLTVATVSVLTSATFIGMFIGALTGGWISDRIGRRRALILSTVWFSAASLLNAFAWESIGLFIIRSITGVGASAMTVVAVTYTSEIFPPRRRGAYQAWILAAGLSGIPATAYVARLCIPLAPWGWRLVFIWGSLALVFPALASRLEESPCWCDAHAQPREALATARLIRPCSDFEINSSFFGSEPRRVNFHRSYVSLAKGPFSRRTLLLVLVWICQTLGFYGFMSWVPTLLVSRGVSLVQTLAWSSAMQLGAVPGALIGAAISDRWQRRWWIAITALATAVCGIAYGLTDLTDVVVIFGFMVVLLIHTFAALLYSYTAECYPTEIRTFGTGLAYGMGRLANVGGPVVVSLFFVHYGYRSVFIYIGICWVIVALAIALFGPSRKTSAAICRADTR